MHRIYTFSVHRLTCTFIATTFAASLKEARAKVRPQAGRLALVVLRGVD